MRNINLRHSFSVLSFALKIGFNQVFAEKIVLLTSFLVYAVIMLLYGGIIKMIPPEDIASFGFSSSQMIWYMGTTELILFTCVSWSFKDIQHEIKSEGIGMSLLRPFSSSLLRVAIWSGEGLARFVLYFPLYIIFMTIFAGIFPMNFGNIIGVLCSLPIGLFILLCGTYMVGASCLWLGQSEISFFIWQKMIFLFGAMMWPIAFYPDWLKPVIWASPFPAMLAAAGNWTLNYNLYERFFIVVHQIIWGLLFLIILLWYDKKVLQRLQKGKG